MDGALRGHAYAKSALDIACWDLLGQALGVPVSTLLGGVRSPDFPLYVAIPLGPAEAMVQHVRDRRAEGVRHFQLKLGADPREDAARVRAVLEEDLDVVVADANGGWRLQDAVIAARALEGLDRVLFEQPCPTLEECLVVRERTALPMVLDEVITDVQTLIRAYGAMEAINLKIGRVGLTKARMIRDLGTELGLRFTIEDSWGGDVTTAAVSHLAASTKPDNLLMASFMNDWDARPCRRVRAPFAPRPRLRLGGAGSRPRSRCRAVGRSHRVRVRGHSHAHRRPDRPGQFAGWRLLTDPTFDPAGGKYKFGWGTGSTKTTGPAIDPAESSARSTPSC